MAVARLREHRGPCRSEARSRCGRGCAALAYRRGARPLPRHPPELLMGRRSERPRPPARPCAGRALSRSRFPVRVQGSLQARSFVRRLAAGAAAAGRHRSRARIPRDDHRARPCRHAARHWGLRRQARGALRRVAGQHPRAREVSECERKARRLADAVRWLAQAHGRTTAGLGDARRTVEAYIDTCIEAFGPARGMFESNFPVDRFGADYATLWNAFKRLAANYSPAEKTALFSGTAKRVYRHEHRLVWRDGVGDHRVLLCAAVAVSSSE